MTKYCSNHLKVVTITERSEVEISWLNNNLSHQIVSTKRSRNRKPLVPASSSIKITTILKVHQI
jgi:hypothetical protein